MAERLADEDDEDASNLVAAAQFHDGKSAAERADQRMLPLGRALVTEPDVWDWLRGVASGPHNRAYSRPEHAFRAAFQAMLVDARVDDDVVDFLVGHEGGVREMHYGRDLVAGARAAVDAIPAVDWGAPAPGNVVRLAR